ncbi:tetratricopeptide repeat protein [Tahibacter amnicola]|uniref:Tetratricopeptide repeat protein n=1 Tax=Tahibacter amnicola TaxID=2976241 RepID=A0ABY6BE19_9GAMM|nr:tetratricopeptide repeat protein [Tahibacter amnicola]UXI67355.1 tetratricopeptide repeat protein [Tahibacter amnicola]
MAQHPHFESFKAAWQAGNYAQALGHIDTVIVDHPQVASLHWYRANCLEKLDSRHEALAALADVLTLKPDHAAALVKQVELDWGDDVDDEDEEDHLTPAQLQAREREAAQRVQRHTAQLRRAIDSDPHFAEAYFALSNLIRHSANEEDLSQASKADALLERAITLAPERLEFRDARANVHRGRALLVPEGTPPEDCVTTFSGLQYLRRELEAALHEFEHCARLDGTHRYYVRIASILHDLGRFDEALAQYDHALALLPSDSPQRDFILEMRARSEGNGAGERDQMARMLENVVGKGERNQVDDMVATALLGAAGAVRKGRSLGDAIAARMPESPDDLMAANIAEQILGVAHEPQPGLVEADAKSFPGYQRSHAAQQKKALLAIGMRHIGDAEATGLMQTLGQRVLLGLYADATGEVGVATFALKPKWPGLVGFVLLLVTGKWKVHRMTECVSHFDDGTHISTQYESISPFAYGGPIDIERIPRNQTVQALVARHRERVDAYKQQRPYSRPLLATDLEGVEERWCAGQDAKRNYRRSIGYATDSELRGLLGAHYGQLGDKVKAKLVELAADRDGD